MNRNAQPSTTPFGTPRSDVVFVVPAHNEESTIGDVVRACADAAPELNAEVLVIDDCSTDATAFTARASGARVISRSGIPSKAAALSTAVNETTSSHLFFVDADCIGLASYHLLRMAHLVLNDRFDMAVGVFDYPVLARLVQRVPWSTGQRLLRRDLFPIGDARLEGYNVEALINERVGAIKGKTASLVLEGVRQRTKRDKLGAFEGTKRTLRMWRSVAQSAGSFDTRDYYNYMLDVHLADNVRHAEQHALIPRLGFVALASAAKCLGP